jgi:DNA (cytosine-5)-methyltransferase 1
LNPSRVFFAKKPDLRPSPYDGHLFNGGGRAIDPNRPCHTILASAGGNKTHFLDPLDLVPEYHRHLSAGGTPRSGELKGARRLTVEESAIIQTFPSWVRFAGPRSAQYHQIGDAVPPLLAAVIGRSLVVQLHQPAAQPRRARTKSLFG